jgi:Rieske Fe-S protein
MDQNILSRREFIKNVGSAALAATIAAPVLGFEASALGGKPPLLMEPIRLDLAKPEYAALTKAGGTLKIPYPHSKKPIIVSRISDTLVSAFSSKCTHWGCEVALPVNNVITCHCHGSKFDATGKVLKGPAKKDLFAFSAALEGTMITIKDNQA